MENFFYMRMHGRFTLKLGTPFAIFTSRRHSESSRCDCGVLSFTGLGLCLLLQCLKGFLDLGYIFWHCLQPLISGLDAALDRAKDTLGLPNVFLNSFPNTLLLVLESLDVPRHV